MGTRNEALGQAAVEYAAQLVVDERAKAKQQIADLTNQLQLANAELSHMRASEHDRRRDRTRDDQIVQKLRQFRGDVEKIRDAKFWKRRGMLSDLLEKVYWAV